MAKDKLIPLEEAQIIMDVQKGKPIYKAVQDAGRFVNSKVNATAWGKGIIEKHGGANALATKALSKIGVTPEFVAQKTMELLEADKNVLKKRVKVKETLDDGRIVETEKLEYMKAPDYMARKNGLDLVVRVVGAESSKKVDITQTSFEAKAVLVSDIRDNPREAMDLIQQLIERKREQPEVVTIEESE